MFNRKYNLFPLLLMKNYLRVLFFGNSLIRLSRMKKNFTVIVCHADDFYLLMFEIRKKNYAQ